jgi:hypothetical protein
MDLKKNLNQLCLYDKRKQGIASVLSSSADQSIRSCMQSITGQSSVNDFVDYDYLLPFKQVNDFTYLTAINSKFGRYHYPVTFDLRKNRQY